MFFDGKKRHPEPLPRFEPHNFRPKSGFHKPKPIGPEPGQDRGNLSNLGVRLGPAQTTTRTKTKNLKSRTGLDEDLTKTRNLRLNYAQQIFENLGPIRANRSAIRSVDP